jgi:hypothetical protein
VVGGRIQVNREEKWELLSVISVSSVQYRMKLYWPAVSLKGIVKEVGVREKEAHNSSRQVGNQTAQCVGFSLL